MASRTVFFLISVFVASTSAALLARNKRQAERFVCPEEDGSFVFPDDCSRYWRCDGGVPRNEPCQPQLLFNSEKGYCDWPNNVQGDCTVVEDRDFLRPGSEALCANPPVGLEDQAFQVAHPKFCNAFYTCSAGYLYAPCTFCGSGMYFDVLSNACRSLMNQPPSRMCNGRIFVPHDQKVYQAIGNDCWPFQNLPNPFQGLVDSLTQAGILRNLELDDDNGSK